MLTGHYNTNGNFYFKKITRDTIAIALISE